MSNETGARERPIRETTWLPSQPRQPAARTAAIDARLPLVGERGIESVEGRPHELIATSIVSSRISMVTSRRVALAGT